MNFKRRRRARLPPRCSHGGPLCGLRPAGAYTEDLPAPGESMVEVPSPCCPPGSPRPGRDPQHPPNGPADPSAESAAPSGVVTEPEPTVEMDSVPSRTSAGSGGESAEQAAVSTLIAENLLRSTGTPCP